MKYLSKRNIIIYAVFVSIVGIYFVARGEPNIEYDFVIAQKSNLQQEVSVSGTVTPVDQVELSFEATGKIAKINKKVGDEVAKDQEIIALDAGDLWAQLQRKQAVLGNAQSQYKQSQLELELEQIKLDEIKKGARIEEVTLSETKVSNLEAQRTDLEQNLTETKEISATQLQNAGNNLKDAKNQLSITEEKADIDLANVYAKSEDVAEDTFGKAQEAVSKQTDELFNADNSADPQLSFFTSSAPLEQAAETGRRLAQITLEELATQLIVFPPDPLQSESLLRDMQKKLSSTRDWMSGLLATVDAALSLDQTTKDRFKSNIALGRTNLTLAVTSLSNQLQLISSQKITNQNNVTLAKSTYNAAKNNFDLTQNSTKNNISLSQNRINEVENSLELAKKELELKKATGTPEQLASQALIIRRSEIALSLAANQIRQAQADIREQYSRISKTVIKAPFAGTITLLDAKQGESVTPNKIVVAIITQGVYEILTHIPEADIAKIQLGNKAHVRLDAYGNDVPFEAEITRIDPAETVIDGVPTYRTTLGFTVQDPRIKSGMTADLDIQTASRTHVLAVPQRAVIEKQNKKFLQTLNSENQIIEKEISTGLKASDGNIEITAGIEEGEKVIVFIGKQNGN